MKLPTYLLTAALLLDPMLARSAEIMVANNAPYTIDEPGNSGFLLDIVKQMEGVLGLDLPVKFLGWKEVQATAAGGHDIMFFPYSRTPEREPNYMWVQKLWDIDEVFVTRPGANPVNAYDEGRTLPSIGVVGGSTGHAELTKRGFDNLKQFANAIALTEALAQGDVAAAYSADIELKYAWRTGRHAGDLVVGKTLATRELYIAASKDSPEIKPADWSHAYDIVRRDGVIELLGWTCMERCRQLDTNGVGVRASRVDPSHAEKALQSLINLPDGL